MKSNPSTPAWSCYTSHAEYDFIHNWALRWLASHEEVTGRRVGKALAFPVWKCEAVLNKMCARGELVRSRQQIEWDYSLPSGEVRS